MTWKRAKLAIDNGFRVKRPAWGGMLERHDSDDPVIYSVLGDGTSTTCKYSFSKDTLRANDFEIVPEWTI